MRKYLAGLALATVTLAAPAGAGTLAFTGTFENVTPAASPAGRCAPALTLSFSPTAVSASGTSNLGSFDVTGSHCVVPPPPTDYSDGVFEYVFASGDVLRGTYTGSIAFTSTPGVLRTVQNYAVTGGTGRFAGAGGRFAHEGTFRFIEGGLTRGEAAFSGTIETVPEPGTIGLIGAALTGLFGLRRMTGR